MRDRFVEKSQRFDEVHAIARVKKNRRAWRADLFAVMRVPSTPKMRRKLSACDIHDAFSGPSTCAHDAVLCADFYAEKVRFKRSKIEPVYANLSRARHRLSVGLSSSKHA